MKHRVAGKKLNRSSNHRRALYKNLLSELVKHGRIKTTKAKAKAIQGSFDSLMTKAKLGGLNQRRQIDQVLNNSKLVNKLVDDWAKKSTRTSGYTRIIPLGTRSGDNAQIVRIEIIDDNTSTNTPIKESKEA